MGSQPVLHYICIEQMVSREDGGERAAYCFQVLDDENGDLLCAVDDICSREEDAFALEELFRRNRVSLVHVMDVLEDWLT